MDDFSLIFTSMNNFASINKIYVRVCVNVFISLGHLLRNKNFIVIKQLYVESFEELPKIPHHFTVPPAVDEGFQFLYPLQHLFFVLP